MSHELRAHSELGASACSRWWNCPGSVALSRGIPGRTSSYAAEGTAAHELAEACLRYGRDVSSFAGHEISEVPVTDEMREAVQLYLDTVRNLPDMLPIDWREIEARFDLSPLNPPAPMFGTADYVAYQPMKRRLYVVDFKYGKGVRVEAEGNPQLRYYALGASLLLGPDKPVSEVVMMIVQPRVHPPVSTATVDALELAEWSLELIDRARATQAPGAPVNAGSWCRFCPASGKCPAQASKALEAAQLEFGAVVAHSATREGWTGEDCPTCNGAGEDSEAEACKDCARTGERYQVARPAPRPPEVRLLTPEQVGACLSQAAMLEDWLKQLRAAAADALARGVEVPGWKLVEAETRRRWKDEAEAAEHLELVAGVPVEEVYTRKVVSPAQAEKLAAHEIHLRGEARTKKGALDMAKVALMHLHEKPAGSPTIAPAADPRPALPAGGSEFLALPDQT